LLDGGCWLEHSSSFFRRVNGNFIKISVSIALVASPFCVGLLKMLLTQMESFASWWLLA
jgi:hypothetical protein